ncbi:hypothetical protein [Xanthobacter aminoxidans]|uniref:hypothetical protein n=1 Tax=Xanthobacter aminoxidans TaxID=186280 RepID=UPI002022E7CC|nr:hypothetical protein [Xanthobacter aminoxidans]MCL8385533.1 hypothetical protein [Xanthobacter aminoxidans]
MSAPIRSTRPPFPPTCPFAPGDIVRCETVAGSGPPLPLVVGQIYTIRAVQQAETIEQALDHAAPVLYLHGYESPFLAFRFSMVVKAPANDDPCESVVIPRLMAQVFKECVASHGHCDVHDLARAGFTAAQIAEFVDEARRLAGPVETDTDEVA